MANKKVTNKQISELNQFIEIIQNKLKKSGARSSLKTSIKNYIEKLNKFLRSPEAENSIKNISFIIEIFRKLVELYKML